MSTSSRFLETSDPATSWIMEEELTDPTSTTDDDDFDGTEGSHVIIREQSYMRSRKHAVTPQKEFGRSSTASIPSPAPEFVMPSVSFMPPQPSQPPPLETPKTPPKQRKVFAASQPSQRNLSQAPGVRSDGNFVTSLLWSQLLFPTLQYAGSIFAFTMDLLRPLIAIVLCIWLIMYLFTTMTSTYMSTSVLAPICAIPFSSKFLPPCAMLNPPQGGTPEFDALMGLQTNFEQVLESSMTTLDLPFDMKQSEGSIRDLRTVVKWSTLPSRDEIVGELGGFIDAARRASHDLLLFNSHIGRAVDRVIVTNKWTLQVLDGITSSPSSSSSLLSSLVPSFMHAHTARTTERLILNQYILHANALEEQIESLITEAQALLMLLQSLDDRLDVIDSIAARDGASARIARDELFAHLWTWLGGNRSSVKKNSAELALLRNVKRYQRAALDHVALTIIALEKVGLGLDDLRERLAAPDVEQSQGMLLEATPLRVHIENIELGLDRLVKQRGEDRGIQDAWNRKVLDSAAVGAASRPLVPGHAPTERREIEAR